MFYSYTILALACTIACLASAQEQQVYFRQKNETDWQYVMANIKLQEYIEKLPEINQNPTAENCEINRHFSNKEGDGHEIEGADTEFFVYRMSCPDYVNPPLSYQMSFDLSGRFVMEHCANVLMKIEDNKRKGEIRTYLLQPGETIAFASHLNPEDDFKTHEIGEPLPLYNHPSVKWDNGCTEGFYKLFPSNRPDDYPEIGFRTECLGDYNTPEGCLQKWVKELNPNQQFTDHGIFVPKIEGCDDNNRIQTYVNEMYNSEEEETYLYIWIRGVCHTRHTEFFLDATDVQWSKIIELETSGGEQIKEQELADGIIRKTYEVCEDDCGVAFRVPKSLNNLFVINWELQNVDPTQPNYYWDYYDPE